MKEENVVASLVEDYLNLKKHEFKSIVDKITPTSPRFISKIETNKYLNYEDTHIILVYNYTEYEIREDKYYHTLNDSLIDITHFTREKDNLLEFLKKELKRTLKEYKINDEMIDLVLNINNDNFFVLEKGLNFIYSYNQFGIKNTEQFSILVNYVVLNDIN
ncbi:MAG: hypothetical protein OSJ65_01645 [Bacilli bacterium]|nr:hypothetical protein [Bacilli bacterium]